MRRARVWVSPANSALVGALTQRKRSEPLGRSMYTPSKVDRLRKDAVQLPHALGEIRIRRLHQQVVVVGHEAVGMNQPIEALAGCTQHVQKRRPVAVGVAEKDTASLVSVGCHMIQRSGELQPQRSCHRATLSKRAC